MAAWQGRGHPNALLNRAIPDSPLVQASAPHAVISARRLSHLRQTLNPEMPALPLSASLDASGQWPVCNAGASPTKDYL